MSINIRLMGLPEEVSRAVEVLVESLDLRVESVSDPYPCRKGLLREVRVYVHATPVEHPRPQQ